MTVFLCISLGFCRAESGPQQHAWHKSYARLIISRAIERRIAVEVSIVPSSCCRGVACTLGGCANICFVSSGWHGRQASRSFSSIIVLVRPIHQEIRIQHDILCHCGQTSLSRYHYDSLMLVSTSPRLPNRGAKSKMTHA